MNTDIKRVWEVEVEILDVVDSICRDNHLRYSLAYGTLIGAVRHKGFIPWDDDIDLMMPREDYEKLISIWEKDPPQGYIMQTEYNTEDLPINHMKIRKDHTAFIQYESEKAKKYHKGIFIDIFPGDRRAPGKVSRKLQLAETALHLLYNRGYTSKSGGIINAMEKVLLSVPGKRALSRFFGERSRKWNSLNTAYVFTNTINEFGIEYPADLFDDLIQMEFEGKQYFVVKEYDYILRAEYGDYMKLPPEEERTWKHHPVLVDFSHNYEEL